MTRKGNLRDPDLLRSKLTYASCWGCWDVSKSGYDQSEWDMIRGLLLASSAEAAIAGVALGTVRRLAQARPYAECAETAADGRL